MARLTRRTAVDSYFRELIPVGTARRQLPRERAIDAADLSGVDG